MIPAINPAQPTFTSVIKKPSNKDKAKLHYIKFLIAEGKFMKHYERYEQDIADYSVYATHSSAKALGNFFKMCYEKLLSVYYFHKK